MPYKKKIFPDRLYIYSPRRICKNECAKLGIDCKNLITGAIIGYAKMDYSTFADDDSCKIVLKNPKRLRVPIPCKGRPGFFKIKMPILAHSVKRLKSEIIDDEFRYPVDRAPLSARLPCKIIMYIFAENYQNVYYA